MESGGRVMMTDKPSSRKNGPLARPILPVIEGLENRTLLSAVQIIVIPATHAQPGSVAPEYSTVQTITVADVHGHSNKAGDNAGEPSAAMIVAAPDFVENVAPNGSFTVYTSTASESQSG